MVDLKGKNCLITGATGALGSALARYLNFEGCNLFLTGRNSQKLDKLRSKLDISKGVVKTYSADLVSSFEVETLCSEIDKFFKNIDILINSAGLFTIKDVDDSPFRDFDNLFTVNVKVPYFLCQRFCGEMKNRKWGKIVNIGSSSSYAGFKGGSLYCMTKHAILGMSRALYEELKEYNIQVMCVSPGSMQSEMAKISVDQDFSTFLKPEDVARQIVALLEMDNNMTCKELRLDRVIIR